MRRPPLWFLASLVACAAAVMLLARASALTFPYPWNDEARFFLPSLEFARTGSLRPGMLHAPEGIFWTPHGFYVVLGLVLRVFGGSMEVARTANQATMAAAVGVLVLAHARLARSWRVGALSGLLLVAPPVILGANEVRMESLVALLYALALLLVARRRVVGALAVLLLSVLVHPALLFALVGIGAVLFVDRMRSAWAGTPGTQPASMEAEDGVDQGSAGAWRERMEWVLLVVAVAAVLLEGVFVLHHWALFRAHMGYQSGRKLHRGLVAALAKPQGLLLPVEAAVFAVVLLRWLRAGPVRSARDRTWSRTWNSELLPAAAMALGLQLYAVLGAEFQYDVYSLALTPAAFFAIAWRLAAERSFRRAGLQADAGVGTRGVSRGATPELVSAVTLADLPG